MKIALLYAILTVTMCAAQSGLQIGTEPVNLVSLPEEGPNTSWDRLNEGSGTFDERSGLALASREAAWVKPAVIGASSVLGGTASFFVFYGIFRNTFDPKRPVHVRDTGSQSASRGEGPTGSSRPPSVILVAPSHPRLSSKGDEGLQDRGVIPRFNIPHWEDAHLGFFTALPFGGFLGGLTAYIQDVVESERAKHKHDPAPSPPQPLNG
ncbi:hypothetical protein CF327_g7346 [Tilletia walkeri]|nr:hypothetical protein CF327_g7346 [Tilletia walkeri]